MGFEAARLALGSVPAAAPGALWFSTATPAYLDKTNATAIHAALRFPGDVRGLDFGGALRSGTGAVLAAMTATDTVLLVLADQRDGLPGGADESFGGDGAAALLIGDDGPGAPVVAEYLGAASATDEFLDRWRTPGDRAPGPGRNVSARPATSRWLATPSPGPSRAPVSTPPTSPRWWSPGCTAGPPKPSPPSSVSPPASWPTIWPLPSARPERPTPDWSWPRCSRTRPGRPPATSTRPRPSSTWPTGPTCRRSGSPPPGPTGAPPPGGRPGGGRGRTPLRPLPLLARMLTPEPPRRPEPARVLGSAAGRSEDWKFAFVGSADHSCGAVHLPPARVSMEGGALDDMEPLPMADVRGTVVTFTVDRLAYSPSPADRLRRCRLRRRRPLPCGADRRRCRRPGRLATGWR